MRQVGLLVNFGAPLGQLLTDFALVAYADCPGEELVGAHADQRPYNAKRHVVASFREGVHPGLRMRVVAVYERAVYVEDHAFEQQPTSKSSESIQPGLDGPGLPVRLSESDS